MSLARGLVVKERSSSELKHADFRAIDDAVRRFARATESLGDIMAMAGTVRSNGEKFATRPRS